MRVLVTGTDGFVGRHVRATLREAGHEVVGTVFFRDAPGEGEVRVDVTARGALDALPPGDYDAVVHTVGLVGHAATRKQMFAVNAEGTRKLLRWAARHGRPHFVQISSIAVYGLRAMGVDRREATTPRMRGLLGLPYMRSKARAERYIERSRLPYTLLRFPAIYGAGDTVVTPAIVGPLRGDGVPWDKDRDLPFTPIYVRNLADVIAKLLAHGPLDGAFNCSDHEMPWRAFVEEYARCLGIEARWRKMPLWSVVGRLEEEPFLFCMANTRFGAQFPSDLLRERLGWQPAHTWQDGVRAAVEALPPAAGA